MGEIAIRVENLSKQYKIAAAKYRYDTLRDYLAHGLNSLFRGYGRSHAEVFSALKDVSFEVNQGEIVGVIGPNGAGKSTLLKILSRITEPTSGRTEIYGRLGSLLEVGTGFDRELTGRDNIYLSGAILGMKRTEIRQKFDEIVAFAEVDRFIDTPVKRYSSGMYVRLAFAVAAHLELDILLVDEVLAVGDAAFQRKCLGKMDDVRKRGRTVLFVSHNMAMIEHLCQRAILLRQGNVTQDGPAKRIINDYFARISDASRTSLAERKDRRGAGEITATAVELLDHGAGSCPHPVSGQELIMRLRYRGNSPKVFKNCRVSISVYRAEHAYFLMSTELVDTRQLDLQGAGYIDFVIPELPLSAGDYYLTSYVESNGVVQDWVVGAASFSVGDGDFYGTGRNYPPGWEGKSVLIKHHWKVNEDISA